MMKLSILLGCAALGATAFPSQAQDNSALGIALCRQVKSDADRLACYDKVGKAAAGADAPALPAQSSGEFGNWVVQESRAPLDDSPQFVGSIQSGDGAMLFVMRCQEKKTEVAIIPKGFFIGVAANGVRVITRINSDPPVTTNWSPSSSHSAAFSPNAVKFMKTLPNNGTLFVRAFGYEGRQADGLIELGPVSAIRQKIATACSWPSQKQ